MDSHFAAIIIWRHGEDGVEFLVIEYDSGLGIQIKFPGGTNNDHPGDTVIETLHRETRDETGLVMPEEPKKIWDVTRRNHTKYAFLISFDSCAGNLRTLPMEDGEDKLSPPFWRTYEELRGEIYRTHAPMLEAAVKELSR